MGNSTGSENYLIPRSYTELLSQLGKNNWEEPLVSWIPFPCLLIKKNRSVKCIYEALFSLLKQIEHNSVVALREGLLRPLNSNLKDRLFLFSQPQKIHLRFETEKGTELQSFGDFITHLCIIIINSPGQSNRVARFHLNGWFLCTNWRLSMQNTFF